MSNARKISQIVVGTEIKFSAIDSDLSSTINNFKSRLDSDDSKIQSLDTALASVSASSGMADSDLKVVADLRNDLDSEILFVRNIALSYTNYLYNATAGQTTFTGNDTNSATLAYTAGAIQVFLNGVLLTAEDYTATDGTSIVLTQPAGLSSQLSILSPKLESNYVAPFNWSGLSEQQILEASNKGSEDIFGQYVALSGDRALVAAPAEDPSTHDNSGALYYYTRSGTTWTQTQGPIRSSSPENNQYLGRISANTNFDRIAVGGFSNGLYIFDRSGTTWSQTGSKLTLSNSTSNNSAYRDVGMSEDGNYVVTGSQFSSGGGTERGVAGIFYYNGSSWSQQASLSGSDLINGAQFGWSCDISGDTAVVSAISQTVLSSFDGALYVFTRSGTSWSQQQKLNISGSGRLGQYGLVIDGDTIAASSYQTTVGSTTFAGVVYVFTRSGSTWSHQQTLSADTPVQHGKFGSEIDLDGDTLVIGSSGQHLPSTTTDVGSAYVFTRTGNTWTQQKEVQASDAANGDAFGYSVGVSGTDIIVGAPNNDSPTNSGRAYVFTV